MSMNTISIGDTSLIASRLAYGCWRVAGSWNPAEVTPQSVAQGKQAAIAAVDQLARAHGVSRAVIDLTWLLKHPARITPIIGSIQPERIRECAKADDLELSREEWYRRFVAARGERLP
jgi:predicted oxidoreductase